MRLVAICEDTPAMAGVRRRLKPAHLEYLRASVGEILIGGGLLAQPGGAYAGGLRVLEVASKERAMQLVEADRYFKAERRPHALWVWGKALPDLEAVL